MLPYVQAMCTCALVSSAMSAAFSPPHVPAKFLGGRAGSVGLQGPSVAAAAANANAAFVSIKSPYQSTLGARLLVTMRTLRVLIVLICAGLPTAHAQRPLDGLDAYVAKAVTDWRVPGLAIVV